MKKLALFAAVAVSLFAVSAADAQTDAGATTTRTSRTTRRTTITARNNADLNRRLRRIEASSRSITTPVPQGSRIDGSVTRAARSRNPFQMINPLAPKEYGDGTDVTRHEPDDAFQRPEGLKLFAFDF